MKQYITIKFRKTGIMRAKIHIPHSSEIVIYPKNHAHTMLLFAHVGLTLAISRLLHHVNLAALALGSMLPDIIDKPLGLIVFGSPNMGRTIAHTLLFLLLFAALSFYTRDIRLISITWGVLAHLILDGMWNSPEILLWPLLGPFPERQLIDTLSYIEMLLAGLKNPGILIPELAGFAYLLLFVYSRRNEASTRIDRYTKKVMCWTR